MSRRYPLWPMLLLIGLAACSIVPKDDAAPKALGDFQLGFNIVVAKNAQVAHPSRTATAEEWEAILKAEVARRFGGYEGGRLYHIGINVDAYALAVPGIPVLVTPKSVIAIGVNIWDDAAGVKLTAEPKRFTVFEEASAGAIIGTGYTHSREAQMASLTRAAVRAVEKWLLENNQWFGAGGQMRTGLDETLHREPMMSADAVAAVAN